MIKTTLKNLGIEALNDMQNAMLKSTKDHREILLLAPTGSGKTLGFLLPAFMNLKQNIKGIQVLIIVPSRELAIQIEQVFKQMGTGFKVNAFYGGHSSRTEKNSLLEAPSVLIGTPGRLAYHFRTEHIDPLTIHTIILDEFDKSLEFGFTKDMSGIFKNLRHVKNKVLTSATMLETFPKFLSLQHPEQLNYLEEAELKPSGLKYAKVKVDGHDKNKTLFKLLCHLAGQSTLVFFNHRDGVDKMSEVLTEMGLKHGIFQGGMEQSDREEALIKFRNGSHHILLCTDLASRGLDIPEIQNIIHYQLPHTEQAFVHRNGRTARMKAEGTVYVLLKETDTLPPFIQEDFTEQVLSDSIPLPAPSQWTTLYFPYGRKEKVNKIDIAGLLYQKGNLIKEELGQIEITDHSAYAAVLTDKVDDVMFRLRNEKIKNQIVKVSVV